MQVEDFQRARKSGLPDFLPPPVLVEDGSPLAARRGTLWKAEGVGRRHAKLKKELQYLGLKPSRSGVDALQCVNDVPRPWGSYSA